MPTVKLSHYYRLLKLLLAHPGAFLLGCILMIVSSIATALGPRIVGQFIDMLSTATPKEALVKLLLAYSLVEATRLTASFAQTFQFQVLGQAVLQRLRMMVLGHVVHLPLSTLDNMHSADVSTRLSTDLSAIGALFSAGFIRVIERLCIMATMFVALVLLDSQLGLLCVSLNLLFAGTCLLFAKPLSRTYSLIKGKISEYNTILSEQISGLATLHLLSAEQAQLNKSNTASAELTQLGYKPFVLFGSLHLISTFAITLNSTLLLILGASRIQDGTLTIGVLVTMISYVLWTLWPLISILNDWHVYVSGSASASRIFEIMDLPIENSPANSLPTTKILGRVEFKNVTFSYLPGTPVLRDVSFIIEPGMKVAIVGPTGSGKSTIANLLLNLYQPDRGEVLFDGTNVALIPNATLRSTIGVVQQDAFLFSGSIGENLSAWQNDNKSNPVFEALKADKQVGEFGANISVGEKQLISFARTAAGSPEVWLMDEATSNLDPNTENLLLQELKARSHGKTVVSIAHRLRTIVDSDLIIVLHLGKVVEQGNHQNLLELNGLYARLYKIQLINPASFIFDKK